MGLLGRTLLATVFFTVALHASPEARASISVSDDGESHDSVWRTSDIGLFLDMSLEDLKDAEKAVGAALAVWEADSRVPRVWPMSGKADKLGYRDGDTNRNTIRFADCGAPQAKGALAITLVSYDSEQGTILDGDIVINGIYRFGDERMSDELVNAPGRPTYDLTDVLVHEFGHWFGLADNPDDPKAVMYPYFDPGEYRNLSLSKSDQKALDTLYASAPENEKTAACSVAAPGASRPVGGSFVTALSLLWVLRWRTRRGSA